MMRDVVKSAGSLWFGASGAARKGPAAAARLTSVDGAERALTPIHTTKTLASSDEDFQMGRAVSGDQRAVHIRLPRSLGVIRALRIQPLQCGAITEFDPASGRHRNDRRILQLRERA